MNVLDLQALAVQPEEGVGRLSVLSVTACSALSTLLCL
jgi:hypothetical protein